MTGTKIRTTYRTKKYIFQFFKFSYGLHHNLYMFLSQMCPIIGPRYQCKDCVEKIGFDLCEGCYNSSSKLPGRFNQQHTKDHQFKVHHTCLFGGMLFGAESDIGNGDSSTNDIRIIYLTNDDSDEELSSAPLELPSEETRDRENSVGPPDSSNDHEDDLAGESTS